MKIGVVTVYNSCNCGSFLQAYAMLKVLEDAGNDVVFLKRKTYRTNKFSSCLWLATKRLLKGRFKRAYLMMEEYFIYKKLAKIFSVTDDFDDCNLAVIGSDTIWNLKNFDFANNWKRYWGVGYDCKKITYGASIGETEPEVFYKRPEFKTAINDFAGVLVRDDVTYEMAKNLLDEEEKLKKVLDPTMLLPVERYDEISKKCKEKDFILIYAFEPIPQKQMEEIKAFAKENNKRIVTFGTDVPLDPIEMVTYYKQADYVITDTFHGNVFSILYNKKFISLDREKSKVTSLINEFGLSDRLVSLDGSLSNLFDKEIDYEKVNQILEEKREFSLKNLKSFTD